ncbi:hypothetical protein B0A49_11449 [Cryomyces minteri]|uniref:Uncharacterized protein n=1 Tax=Cryomyces minteri TaxID=331657 RepID=A0A4U0WQN2_9PEZI|nr:hypothetical protein B0A49_11449 [Cryomyces minteri]
MDIHRARFVPYPPSTINALAFSRSSDKGGSGGKPAPLRLAIGRANGDIEIWNPLKGAWAHETTFPGGNGRTIEGLVWTQEPDEVDADGKQVVGQLRLFSIGFSSAVTEWSLSTGLPLRQYSGNHSEIWCLAAQPRWQPAKKMKEQQGQEPVQSGEGWKGQNLVAGCADGSLAVLSTADNDLTFEKFVTRASAKKARCLSVTYQNRHTVVAGFADSTIRVYDVRKSSLLRNMSLGAGQPGGPREILVWAVRSLPNGNIVSGDSTGEVRFWDGKSYSLLQRVAGHESDVLDIVTSQDGHTVLSGGMDRRTVVYRQTGGEGAKKRWAKITHRRIHKHDVKTMAAFENNSMSVVVSGGVDVNPIITPLREFGRENHRNLPGVPQQPAVAGAPGQRLLVSWWDRDVNIWRIGRQHENSRKLVARIAIKGDDNITSAAITRDGKHLAVSTSVEVKVFELHPRNAEPHYGLRIRKIDLPQRRSTSGARIVRFSPDGRWLAIVTMRSEVLLVRVVRDQTSSSSSFALVTVELRRLHRKDSHRAGLDTYDRVITRAEFSPDSGVLVVGDLAGFLDSWVVEGHEDLTAPAVSTGSDTASLRSSSEDSDEDEEKHPTVVYGQHWICNPSGHLLPRLDSAPLVLSFRPSPSLAPHTQANGNPGLHPTRHNPLAHSHELPSGEHRLFVMSAQHHIYEFDVLAGRLSDWSRRNPTSSLPDEFRGVRDRAMGCVWDVTSDRQRYGSTQSLSNSVADGYKSMGRKRKRSTIQEDEEDVQEVEDLRRHTTGAGSKVPEQELKGLARKIRKIQGTDTDGSQWASLDERQAESLDDESGDETAALEVLRRGNDERSDGVEENAVATTNGTELAIADGTPKRSWWCSYKYRPILGIVAISDEGADEDSNKSLVETGREESERPLEVVLVERPLWI